jgi:hypothetical protein
VILELKFNDRAPVWMSTLTKIFNLRRQAMCKYNALMDSVGLPYGKRLHPMEQPLLAAQWYT